MGKKARGKTRKDKYYHLAKENQYQSRAAFKLTQLDDKYRFLHSSRALLDLCAAPGGWMKVAVERMPVGSFVLGIDLYPIAVSKIGGGAIALEEDITTSKCRSEIKKTLNERGRSQFEVVLHDGSPNMGGNWHQEATAQNALVIDAVKLAVEFLAPKGTFVSKVFRSQDYTAILYCLKQLFDKVEVTKPDASRTTSAEIFVIGLRYKAPAKIDPRLLDVKFLFDASAERPKVVDVLGQTKQKRNREGYEDGVSILRKVCQASDFVWSDTPLDVLGSVTCISFDDPSSSSIKDHVLTTEEIKLLCDDLHVLGKQDFKLLLKWRLNIRKALFSKEKVVPETTITDEENKMDDDDRMLNEMEELTHIMERKKRRAKKLLMKRKAKDKARKATGMQIDAMEDGYTDFELFSLSSIKGKSGLKAVESTEFDDEVDDLKGSGSEDNNAAESDNPPSDLDTDEEHQRYDKQLEEFLDQAYERFVTKTEGKTKQRKRAKKAFDTDELWKGGEDDGIDPLEDVEKEDEEEIPLLVPLHKEEKPTQDQVTEQWFSQDVFAEAMEDDSPAKNDSDDEHEDAAQEKSAPKNATVSQLKETIDVQDMDEREIHLPSTAETTETTKGVISRADQQDDFEVVPADPMYTSDDSSDDESEYDSDSKAEILAYAKKMLRKRQREQILDDAYNRYVFDDVGLPTWFSEDEKRHSQPMKPVTKEEAAAMKAQFREIDARPSKKVAEAKARKKRIATRKFDAARRKADTISDQTDISEKSKNKMIDKLYKKAVVKKPERKYVVAKKGVQVRPTKGNVLVDRRMKSDKRTHGAGKSGKKGSGKRSKGVRVKSAKGGRGKGDAAKGGRGKGGATRRGKGNK